MHALRWFATCVFIALTTAGLVTGRESADVQGLRSDRATSTPPVLLVDGEYLAQVRARLRKGDSSLSASLTALEQDAKRALSFAPVSVMDKGVMPPSGDKHDYMSQAPYWWPDPAKPDGRPYIRRDGERNPEISRITDRDNLGRLTNAVWTLGLAFYFTGREEYAAHAARLTRTWFLDPATRMNPHLKFGQGIPGINDGRGIGIIETRSLPDLLDGVILLEGAGAWTPADMDGIRRWVGDYLSWLLESPHGREEGRNGNNHETWYDVQVVSLALFTDQRELARRTLETSRARIGRQIEPDGRQPRELERTRSWDYSTFNLRAFFHLAELGQRVGVDLWNYRTDDGRNLRRALDFLLPYAPGRQPWPHAQITTVRPDDLHWLLRHAAIGWKEPKYRALAMEIGGSSELLNLLVP